MKLLKRIQFALKYDFDGEFVVYDFENQNPYRFLNYEDAKKHSDSQIPYRPKVMMGVTKA